ncbi:heavy metal-responsive transcriptional regulator [Thermomonas carbonis]|uniref:Heavy metal-responsive transcriptional regulator n=1 Tax=Thermomonas carbonis TaxID=1463158 RepID=A0A7G9SRY6_9GAMM|nr:heavy metal-responsive transcriptional regulator [Thermomonas carbonis]QNN70611.1 heavy metal-responsive transcriptional regulator [Thermomonas carbonis]GHC01145.1 Hg(II)-responsive transcriptional regulator [Thermomonas carbonis]
MKIGELAKRADVPIDTVRYYEREGLIPPPIRRASGYRDYVDADVDRLRFMRRAKGLGFTLHEIRDLLSLTAMSGDDMAALNAQTQAKLRDVEERIHSLTRIREALKSLVTACPGHGALDRCPILAALSEDRT